MNQEQFISEVMHRAGFQQSAMASLAIDATLEVLGQRLSAAYAQDLLNHLPEGVGHAVLRGPHGGSFDRDELFRRVSRREGVRLGFAVEHTQVVYQLIAETLGEPQRERLRQRLPADIAELFTPRAAAPPVTPRPHRRGGGQNTLASGRPGGKK